MKKYLAFLLFGLISSLTLAGDFADCRNMFADGKAPIIASKGLKLRPLCYQSFAVMHSGQSRTPFYVAERLNKASVSPDIERATRFFADARLPQSERAELDDYKNSGYDRGHMAPAADMPDDIAMAQCFTLANMVPQAPMNNRKTWAKIESDTRKYVTRAGGEVYVITGPFFGPNHAVIGPGKVWVPTHLFKLVYDPAKGKAWAHWIENTDTAKATAPITLQALIEHIGYNPMPGAKVN